MALLKIEYERKTWEENIRHFRATPEQVKIATLEGLARGAASLRKRFQEAARGNKLGWPALATYSKTGAVIGRALNESGFGNLSSNRNKKARSSRGVNMMGQLIQILRYSVKDSSMSATVGLLPEKTSLKTFDMFRVFQEGTTISVTGGYDSGMRGLFAAAGMPLRKTTTALKQPSRALINPVWEAEKGNVAQKINAKITTLLRNWIDKKQEVPVWKNK